MQVKRHKGGRPTTRLTLQKADNLSRDILNYSGNPPKEETDWHSFPLKTRMSRDPYESHRIVSGKIIQCPLVQSYQCGCSCNSLKSFQCCLTIRANTDVFLWLGSLSNFIDRGQDSTILGWKTSVCLHREIPPAKGMPQYSSPNSLLHFWPICMPDESFNHKTSSLVHASPVSRITPYKILSWPHYIAPHTEYITWSLNLHQHNAVSSNGEKVRPAP